jgi:hypothetical protein
MKNHCVNILRLQDRFAHDIETLLEKYLREDKSLDFNKVIEMPKELKESMKSLETACENPKIDDRKIFKLEKEIRDKNLEGYGFETPEEWADENWGTEFNCYDCHIDEEKNSLLFDTTGTPPLPVIQELAKQTKRPLLLIYAEPGEGIYGEMKVEKTGETTFKDYTEETIPPNFHKEFPSDYPPKNKTKPSEKNKTNQNKKKTKVSKILRNLEF